MQPLLLMAVWLAAPPQAAPVEAAPAQTQAMGSLDDRMKVLDTIDLSDDPAARLEEMKTLLADARVAGTVTADKLASIQANIGGALFYLRRYEEAVAAVDEAAAILEAAGLGGGAEAAALYSNGATILADMGAYERALERHRKALAIRTKLFGERHLDVGSSSFGIGYVLFRQGKVEESLDWMRRGAELQLAFGRKEDPLNIVRQTSYASVLGSAGRIEESIVAARKAADHAETNLPDLHPMRGIALNNLGTALDRAGQYAEAEPVFRRALDLRVAVHGKEHPNTALALKNLGTALYRLGRAEEAEALMLQALATYQASGETADPTAAGTILANLASIAGDRGDAVLMEERLRAAIADLEKRSGKEHVALVNPRTELASLLGPTEGPEATSLAAAAAAIARREMAPDHPERAAAEIVEGRLIAAGGDPGRGYAVAAAAATALERRALDFATSRYDAMSVGPLIRLSLARFTELALDTDNDEAAFRALQLANLTDTAATFGAVAARAATTDPESARLARALQDATRKAQLLRSGHAKALAAKDNPEIVRLSAAIAAHDATLRGTEAEIERRFPDYRALSRPAPVSLAEFRAGLTADAALVAPLVVDDRLLTLIVTREGLAWARSDMKAVELARTIGAVRRSIEGSGLSPTPAFDRKSAHALYRGIFPAAAEAAIARAKTLHIYGGASLASLPLGLLVTRSPTGADHDPAALRRTAWLIRDRAVAVPVTLARRRMPAAAPGAAIRFAGFGGPALAPAEARMTLAGLFRGGAADVGKVRELPSLPAAEAELRRMGQALGGAEARIVTGAAATEAAVKGANLEGVSVLAFATHGLVSGEMAGVGEPALVFTPPDKPMEEDDGLLTASEISTLKLDADWVILSACNTAAGANGGSPNYSGLARAFIHAGGRSLLLSHWNVRDDAAARLTVDTVRGAAKAGRPQALRKAMLALMNDRRVPGSAHPAIWAPFVLIGE